MREIKVKHEGVQMEETKRDDTNVTWQCYGEVMRTGNEEADEE